MLSYFKNKIINRSEKRISFYEYMADCLYHPQQGYYMKQKKKIGKQGDYYTSSSVHPVFSETFADMCVDIFEKQKGAFCFCEMGAGTGHFAKQFLDRLQQKSPDIYHTATYTILDKSTYHQQQQKIELKEHLSQVKWVDDLEQISRFRGVLFSNELVDAFPVYLIEKKEGMLFEVGVTWSEQKKCLEEIMYPLETMEIKHYLKQFKLEVQDGQRMEIPIDALKWVRQVGQSMEEGIWLTVDYGYTTEELQLPQHRRGSLLCYDQHQVDEKPLEKPGQKDITSHVHFDVLAEAAHILKWKKLGFYTQADFLLRAGMLNRLEESGGRDPFLDEGMKRNRAIRQLISPEGISGSFHVLILGKGSYLGKEYSFLKPFSFQEMF